MNKTIYFLLILFFPSFIYSQPQVGHTQFTYVDSSRGNRQIQTELYYPATTAGNNTLVDTGTFPLIVFGHGFVMVWSAYQNFWESLIPEGYILAFPTTESGFSPAHSDFGMDLKFLVSEIKNSGAGSVIPSSSIGNTSAIMGHSMGGGCSFLAAENNTDITTMVTFAAAVTNPSSVSAAQNISIPTLVFSGSGDCVAPPAQHQDLMYDSCTSSQKTQIYITNGGHCNFADYNLNCSFGEATCSPGNLISMTDQQAVVTDFLKLWLDYFLKGNCNKAQEFQDSLLLSSRITNRQNQPIACSTKINEPVYSFPELRAYPNPASGSISIDLTGEPIRNISIYNTFSKKLKEIAFNEIKVKQSFDVSMLKDGIYLLIVNDTYRIVFTRIGF